MVVNERDIFVNALNLDAQQRVAFVRQACKGNDGMQQRVEQLLAAHDQAGSFLAAPAAGPMDTSDFASIAEATGSIVGPYKLLQRISEGGFGVVYMAEQTEPVRRKVALKIIKPGMDSKEVIARFESERQALALMDIPTLLVSWMPGRPKADALTL